jgi:16S rRNA processing protein RimM
LDNYFQIGIIVKSQGIKGELRVLPTTDEPSRFELLSEVTVSTPHKDTVYAIESVRHQKNLLMLKLKGIDDRNAAEALKHARLLIPPELALPLDENEFFIRDLIGIRVFTDNDGEPLGILTQVLSTGANDVYVVTIPDGKEILLPAIKDCILSVSVSEKKMLVHVLDGLLS